MGNLVDYALTKTEVRVTGMRRKSFAYGRERSLPSVFRKMMAFVRKADISYKCFAVDKHFGSADTAVHDKLLQSITRFLIENAQTFNSFDVLKVYYDNGQSQVKSLLKEAFAMYSSTVEFVPDVHPANYRLFQAADFICTIELIAAKSEGMMTESEKRFFGSRRVFLRDILRQVRRKSF